jgi:DNA-binding transcriptional MerR regulator
MRERKRLIRLLVTDVTLLRTDDQITVSVRFPAGQHHTLHLPRPRNAWQLHTTPDSTIATIDELLNTHPFDETVTILNQRGLTGGWGKPFTVASLTALCRARNIPSHAHRLRAAGMLTLNEIAGDLDVTTATAKRWHRLGLIVGHRIDGRGGRLYEPHQPRPAAAQVTASQRTGGTAQLITGFQLADRLSVSPSTVRSWSKAGLITAHAVDRRGFNLYHPDQTRPAQVEIIASQRPPGTAECITGGQLAAKLARSRSAIYKWYQLGLIDAVGTDKTGRHLYQPDQQPPTPQQIRQARAASRELTTSRHHLT